MSEQDSREGHPGPAPDSPIERLPTHQAAARNNVTELSDLVQGGAQLLGTDTKETPLHAAAKKGALDSLKWLLDNKTVSPLEKAGNGNTAAHYAAVYGHLESLKVTKINYLWNTDFVHKLFFFTLCMNTTQMTSF